MVVGGIMVGGIILPLSCFIIITFIILAAVDNLWRDNQIKKRINLKREREEWLESLK